MADDPCPTADTLSELVEGGLSTAEADKVHHHVRSCTRCRMVLAGLGAAVQSEEEASAPDPVVMKPGGFIGRFQLVKLLGRGGMGSVWAASDHELGREVAIKVLTAGLGSSGDPAGSRARLLREAKAMARLAHPNVVPVFEVGDVAGRLFLVMEQVDGQTLGGWLREKRSPAQILEMFLGAGLGLAAAHAAGVIHRDFKPDNVLVGADGRPRVTDFGLARGHVSGEHDLALLTPQSNEVLLAAAGDETLPSDLTPIGALLGTPAYMSPEQMRGQKAEARSDLFAWCTALFEALTGARPFPAASLLDTRKKIEAGQLEWPASSRVPRWLRRELEKGLQANPEDRHQSMDELLAVVRRGRAAEEHRWLWFAAAAALLVVVAATLLGSLRKPALPQGARSLAVLFPRDASPQADDAWIAPVLEELITSELDGDPGVHLIPIAEVAAAMGDLGLRGASPIASDLPRLRERLGADLILGGKYTLTDGKLSCELALWEPKGEAIVFSEQGSPSGLTELGARLGADARLAMHLKARPAQGTEAFPTNLEAARLYAEGLQFLHNLEAARAVLPLQKAATLTPENPRIQLALVEAFSALHRDVAARDAALRAFQAKGVLTPDEQVYAEIAYRRSTGDYTRAIELATARYKNAPGNLQLGLDLLDTLNAAGRSKELIALAAELHKLPPPSGEDPRIYLLEGSAHDRLGEESAAPLERAYQLAKQRGARKQMAAARYSQANAIRGKDINLANSYFDEAVRLYGEVGDQRGAAMSTAMQATIYADLGDLPRAQVQLEAATKVFGDLGDSVDEALMLSNLAVLLRRARRLPEALSYAGRAATLNMELGQPAAAAASLQVVGNLRADLGDYAGAAESLTRSIELRRQNQSKLIVSGLVSLAIVRYAQADFPAAHKLLDEALAPESHADALGRSRIDYAAANLAFAEGRMDEALAAARRVLDFTKTAAQPDDYASAQAVIATILVEQGHLADARAAIDLATTAIAGSKSKYLRMPVLVAEAKVRAAEHPKDLEGALRDVRAAAATSSAEVDKWQAEGVIAELELNAGKPGAVANILALIREARSQGRELDARQAEKLARTHKINIVNVKLR